MSEPVQLRDLMAQWVGSLNPEAEIRYRQVLCREAYERGQAEAYSRGYVQACADIKAAEHAIYDVLSAHHKVSVAKWRIYCERCSSRPRADCPDCEYRTRETFSQSREGDFQGTAAVTP